MKTLDYPEGGHLWVYLNWALSFAEKGWDVVWLDLAEAGDDDNAVRAKLERLRVRLAPFGFSDRIVILDADGEGRHDACVDADTPDVEADLLFNLRWLLPEQVVRRFPKTALLDTDPGMVQISLRHGPETLPAYDARFTVGNDSFLDEAGDYLATGLTWHAMLPAVSLAHWPVTPVPQQGAFSTVSHWYMQVWMHDADGVAYANDKQTAFEPYLHLPQSTGLPMSLALSLGGDAWTVGRLGELGWEVREAHDEVSGLDQYQAFIRRSAGEFSCCKPSYRRQRTGWISDRTACYLATGRPCVVEWSGPRPELEGVDGLLRFRDPDEAAVMLRRVAADPAHHASAARALAEEHFDGRKCVDRVLDLVGGV